MLKSLKEWFLTLKTIEGRTYLWVGGLLIAAYFVGLVDFLAALTPLAGIVMVAAGLYKTFTK